jgi:hypothetical protein
MFAFVKFVPHGKHRKACSARTTPHLRGRIVWPSQHLYGQCCRTYRSLALASSDAYMFSPLNDSVRGRMTRHCRKACVSDSRRRWENFIGQEDMPSFKHGRTLLTNMDALLKNNYAFSNAVAKYCYIFMYPACTSHGIKQEDPLFSNHRTFNIFFVSVPMKSETLVMTVYSLSIHIWCLKSTKK